LFLRAAFLPDGKKPIRIMKGMNTPAPNPALLADLTALLHAEEDAASPPAVPAAL